MKVDVVAIAREYGFDMTIAVSVVNATDGTPLDGLTGANFQVTVIQGPSGWSVGEVLSEPSIFEPAAGVYALAVEDQKKKLTNGTYTFLVAVKGYKGWAPLHGQTLVAATMK